MTLIDDLKKDFESIKIKKSPIDETSLVNDLIQLIGLYETEQSDELYTLIKEMIEFSEQHGIQVSAQRLTFNEINRRNDIIQI